MVLYFCYFGVETFICEKRSLNTHNCYFCYSIGPRETPGANSQVELPVQRPREGGRISYETVKIATNNFQARIGQGSFGPVYRGFLNDRDVAVKVNAIQSPQGRKEFIAEVCFQLCRAGSI